MKKVKVPKPSFAEVIKTIEGVRVRTMAYSPDGVQMEITSISVGEKDFVKQAGGVFSLAF